ncbi:S46 family peptidase [Caulobacter segnis]
MRRLAAEEQDRPRLRAGPLAAASSAAVAGDWRPAARDQTLRCQAIGFFRGGHDAKRSSKYRRYNGVRLVFAPELASAAFGSDPGSLQLPALCVRRRDSCVAVRRRTRRGRDAGLSTTAHWRSRPPAEGEPTFVVGNPGSTERQLTLAQLETQRDLVRRCTCNCSGPSCAAG